MEERLGPIAEAAALAGAAVLRAHAGGVQVDAWEGKRASDFVTFVDREAEQEVLRVIRAARPHDPVLAEEGTAGTLLAGAGTDAARLATDHEGTLWVIDPLDGTTNFLHGYPMYAVSVAAVVDGEPVAGAVVDGAAGDAWCAERNRGATRNGAPLSVSSIDALAHALIGTGFPFKTPGRIAEHFAALRKVLERTSGARRGGSAALDLCHVAAGYLDGFFELELAPWDIAAGVLLVREAGGLVTDLAGRRPVTGAAGVLAGNPMVHRLLGSLVGGEAASPGAS